MSNPSVGETGTATGVWGETIRIGFDHQGVTLEIGHQTVTLEAGGCAEFDEAYEAARQAALDWAGAARKGQGNICPNPEAEAARHIREYWEARK